MRPLALAAALAILFAPALADVAGDVYETHGVLKGRVCPLPASELTSALLIATFGVKGELAAGEFSLFLDAPNYGFTLEGTFTQDERGKLRFELAPIAVAKALAEDWRDFFVGWLETEAGGPVTSLQVSIKSATVKGKAILSGATEVLKLDLKVKGEYSAVPVGGGDRVVIKFGFSRKGSGPRQP